MEIISWVSTHAGQNREVCLSAHGRLYLGHYGNTPLKLAGYRGEITMEINIHYSCIVPHTPPVSISAPGQLSNELTWHELQNFIYILIVVHVHNNRVVTVVCLIEYYRLSYGIAHMYWYVYLVWGELRGLAKPYLFSVWLRDRLRCCDWFCYLVRTGNWG